MNRLQNLQNAVGNDCIEIMVKIVIGGVQNLLDKREKIMESSLKSIVALDYFLLF